MEDYKIVRISEELLPDLRMLYKASFGKTYAIDYLKSKFNTSYTGVSYVGYIAYDKDNKPAAYYGVFPCYITSQENEFIAAQSGDTMTHPLHQGKGLFTKLAKLTYELAQSLGVKFVFGFPNENSYPGFIKKLNWKDKGPMEIYTLRQHTIPFSSLIQFFKIKHFYIQFISKYLFNKVNSEFTYSSIIREGFGGIFRSKEYLLYKGYERNFVSMLQGKKIWLKIDHRLIIGDLEIMPSSEFQSILRSLKRRAFFAGIRRVIFITSPGTYYSKEFKKIKGIQKGNTIHDCYLNEFDSTIDPEQMKFTGADWDSF